MHNHKCNFKFIKRHNQGSALIVVLIAVCFITVLATMILSVSSVNLQMKQTNYEMKKDFYSDERALDDVYNGIGKSTNECLASAYSLILSEIQDSAGNPKYLTQADAYKAFANAFTDNLKNLYPQGPTDTAVTALLNSYIINQTEAKVNSYKEIAVRPTSATDSTPYQFIFKEVNVRFLRYDSAGNPTDFESSITTDIVVEVPYISFFTDSSKILDYVMVANKGIYFNGATRNVYGNVYAGTDYGTELPTNIDKYRDTDVYGGLNFYDSHVDFKDINYLISKGDINIRKSDVNVEKDKTISNASIWAESLRTVESKNKSDAVELSNVDIRGNSYIANDLELNARESNVKLSGSLYAYNNGIYATQEKGRVTAKYDSDKHTTSSAILINGKKSSLDLTELNTMVVAGLAYIDLKSTAYATVPNSPPSIIHEYATGESLALRTNQYMYLAPTSCLTTTNPVLLAEEPSDGIIWVAGSDWFATAKGFVDDLDPLVRKVVRNNTTSEDYVYYFLNFKDNSKRVDYANLVLNIPERASDGTYDFDTLPTETKQIFDSLSLSILQQDQIWNVKKYIKEAALADQTKSIISIPAGTTANIYMQGVLSMSDGSGFGATLIEPEQKFSTEQITRIEGNIHKHYPWLYRYLDPKEEFSFDSDPLPMVPSLISPEADEDMPLSEYIDLSALLSDNGTGPNYLCNGAYHTYIKNSDYTLTDASFKGIILCDGDVTISASCASIEGIILATGKIYVEGNGELKANKSIVQQILDEEIKDESRKEVTDSTENMDYACNYFKKYKPVHIGDTSHRVTGTDFTDYISFANWHKSE